jgi:hypothetical protein
VNVFKPFLRITIATLLSTATPHREIERRTGVDRKMIRRYANKANAPGWPPALGPATSKLPHPGHRLRRGSPGPRHRPWRRRPAPHRALIEAQVALGRNAMSIFQDLVDGAASNPPRYWRPYPPCNPVARRVTLANSTK